MFIFFLILQKVWWTTKFSKTQNEIKKKYRKLQNSQKQTKQTTPNLFRVQKCHLQIYKLATLLNNLTATITWAAKSGRIDIGDRTSRAPLLRRRRARLPERTLQRQNKAASPSRELDKRRRGGGEVKVSSSGDLPLVSGSGGGGMRYILQIRWRSGSPPDVHLHDCNLCNCSTFPHHLNLWCVLELVGVILVAQEYEKQREWKRAGDGDGERERERERERKRLRVWVTVSQTVMLMVRLMTTFPFNPSELPFYFP